MSSVSPESRVLRRSPMLNRIPSEGEYKAKQHSANTKKSTRGNNNRNRGNRRQRRSKSVGRSGGQINPKSGRSNATSYSANSSPNKTTELYKTELCRTIMSGDHCKYGTKCRFAHNDEEMRQRDLGPRYKTVICKSFERDGVCSYGLRCRFIHHSDEEDKVVLSPVVSPIQSPDFTRARAFSDSSHGGSESDPLQSPPMSPEMQSPRSPLMSPPNAQRKLILNSEEFGQQFESHCSITAESPTKRLPFFSKGFGAGEGPADHVGSAADNNDHLL